MTRYDSYEEYLASPEFDEIRQAVFKRDGFRCVVCGNTQHLEPHHLTYIHKYKERLTDLVTLCDSCHRCYHAVDIMKRNVEEMYQDEREKEIQKMREENDRIFKEKRAHEAEVCLQVAKKFKTFIDQDYCKDGDYNLCEYKVVDHFVDEAIAQLCLSDEDAKIASNYISKKDLTSWVRCRRLEFLQRCMEQGRTINDLCQKTKFEFSWLNKWYNSKAIESQLKQEKLLGGYYEAN